MTIWITEFISQDAAQDAEVFLKQKSMAKQARQLAISTIKVKDYNGRDKSSDQLESAIEALVKEVSLNDTVFMQYPSQQLDTDFDMELINQLKSKEIDLIGIVWDIPAWHFNEDIGLEDDFMQVALSNFDRIIVENEKIAAKISSQSKYQGEIYILKLNDMKSSDNLEASDNKGDCKSTNRNYIFLEENRLNNSLQLSQALANFRPVIVNNGSVQAEFIKKHKLGLTYDDFDTLDGQISKMSQKDYEDMLVNVDKIGSLLNMGYFYKKALLDSIEID